MNDASNMDRVALMMDALSPIFDQLKSGVPDPDAHEGDVFDAFVRGYIFGYINNLIAFRGGGSIDTNPNAAMEIFNVMMGSIYTGGDEGVTLFRECLADRNASDDAGGNHDFAKGFIAGESDHSIIVNGSSIHKLSNYLSGSSH